MSNLQQAEQLKQFMEEIFEVSKDFWAAQSKTKSKNEADITETEFLALDMLSKSDHPLTVGDIQKRIGVLPAQMSRVIRSLESKGGHPLIACRINPVDKRKVDVEITPAGRKNHQDYRQMKLGTIEKTLRCLSEQDRGEFMRILRQIRENVRKA